MALIIEDGSGYSNAQSYVSTSDLIAYSTLYGLTTPSNPEVAIMHAMRYLEGAFFDRWVGYKKTEEQALSWPRAYAARRDGWAVSESEIPKDVKDAVCVLAIKYGTSSDLLPDMTAANRTKKEQIGPIMVQYADNALAYTVYRDVEFILTSLLTPRNFAKAVRT